MPTSLNKNSIGAGHSTIYFTQEYKTLIEDHLPILKKDPSAERVVIPSHLAMKYNNNFTALLADPAFGIDYKYHWAIMRVNGFHHPAEFKETMMSFIKPYLPTLEGLTRVHRTIEGEVF
jgi:hypothetical protein